MDAAVSSCQRYLERKSLKFLQEWLEACVEWIAEENNVSAFYFMICSLNPLSANPAKWSNTLKQFVGNSRSSLIYSRYLSFKYCVRKH